MGWDELLRVLSATPSQFWLIDWLIEWCGRTSRCAHAHASISVGLNFFRVQCPCNFLETRTCRYDWNEREISRLQATTPSSEAAWTKTNKPCLWENEQRTLRLQERRLQLGREARKRREQSRRGLKKQTRKHRRDSKLNGSEGCASRRQSQTAEQKLAGCWIKAKVYSTPCKCG